MWHNGNMVKRQKFIDVDSRGRTNLAKVRSQAWDRYLVEELEDGVLMLTPAVTITAAEERQAVELIKAAMATTAKVTLIRKPEEATPAPAAPAKAKAKAPATLDKGKLAKLLGDRRARTVGPRRTAMITSLKAHGAASSDAGWKWLSTLDTDQVAILVGSHVETEASAWRMLAMGGAPPDKVNPKVTA
jgi:hypothetical protein